MTQPTSIAVNFSSAVMYGDQNNSKDNCSDKLQTEEWIITVVPVYIMLISVLGIVFNVFVLMVFCLHKKACTVADIYLSNLAAADLVLVSCLPFWAVNVSRDFDWPFGQFLCKVVSLGISMNTYCSIYFLILVSVDRYLALVHAMSFSRMRKRKYAKLGCLLVWVLGFFLSVPTLIYRVATPECNSVSCYLAYSDTVHLVYVAMLTVLSFIIPISLISYCTVKIIQTLNNHANEMSNTQNMEHKATILVLVVLLAFLICSVPYHLTRMVEALIIANLLNVDNTILDICFQIFTYLAFFNSVLNPILYVIVGKNFRGKAQELFMQRGNRATFKISTMRSSLARRFEFIEG